VPEPGGFSELEGGTHDCGRMRQEYNNYQPHSLPGYLTPVEFARRYYENNNMKNDLTRGKAGTVSF